MSKIVDRLTSQLKAQGVKDPEGLAIAKLQSYGILDDKGNLTPLGEKRNAMTPEERAIDRASSASGRPASEYVYHSDSNRATLKKKLRADYS